MIVLSNLKKNKFLLLAVIIAFAINAFGQHKLTVDVKKTVAVVSPQMWGIFFEDINFDLYHDSVSANLGVELVD